MIQNPLANLNPADMQEFRNHQSLPPDQQGDNLQRLLGNGFSFNKLLALKSQADQASKAQQAQQLIMQAQQAGGSPSPMGQNSTVVDDLQAQIHAALYPQQQQQMPQQMAQGQMPPQGQPAPQMPPQQMAQAQMPTQQMAHGGLAQLPVTNFRDENYAGGGIVAFVNNKEQPVRENMPTEDELTTAEKASFGGSPTTTGLSEEKRKQYADMTDAQREENSKRFELVGGIATAGLGGGAALAARAPAYVPGLAALLQGTAGSIPGAAAVLPSLGATMVGARAPSMVEIPTTQAELAGEAARRPPEKSTIRSSGGEPEERSVGPTSIADAIAKDKVKSGLPVVTNAARADERARRSDIGTGRDKTGAEESLLSPEMQEAQKYALETLKKRKDVPEKSLEAIAKEQKDFRSNMFKELGISEKGHEEHINELRDQAKTARADRDTDRLMGIAQGFFTMAGGTSPYALKNMADGFGVTTKAVLESEKEYRKGEVARKASIDALKQAQRAEAIGDADKVFAARERHDALVEKAQEHNQTSAGLLLSRIGVAESTARTAQEGRLSREAIARQTQALVGEQRDARLAETARRNEEAERQKFAAFKQRVQEKHPLMVKGTLPNALTELEVLRARLATKPTNPDFIKQFNFAQSQVDAMKDQVANESERDASRMMGTGSGWGKLTTTGGKS